MSIEAMKQALEALEKNYALINGTERFLGLDQIKDTYYAGCLDVDGINKQTNDAITALRTAIEQAEKQEPVAWMTHSDDLMPLFHRTRKGALNWQTQPTPLYTAPRQWVGLTEIEICDIEADELTSASSETFSFARAIEAKLKEKNERLP